MNQSSPTASYLFYDLETTGLNPCFDQVLQFAAIRTDLELNPLESYEIKVKLNCDIIPAPGAIITHLLGLSTYQTGMKEIDAIKQIHQLLNTPQTINIGYNNLGFDDEFLRFSFYRNLLPPYSHQYANGCKRMDLYPMCIMYYLFHPTIIVWPKINEEVSLKLENLSQANQLAEGQAHDAMTDVLATLALAKKFFQNKSIWDYLCGYFDKKTEHERMPALSTGLPIGGQQYRQALIIQGKLGKQAAYQAPVIHLGPSFHYKNQNCWLRLDQKLLQQCSLSNIAETTFVIRKKQAEQEFILPLHERFLSHLELNRRQCVAENQKWLQAHPDIFQAICDYYQNFQYPTLPEIDIDAALYQIDFPSPQEELLFKKFHYVDDDQKFSLAAQFSNRLRQEQVLRILGRHYPHSLTDSQLEEFNSYLQKSNFAQAEQAYVDFRGNRKLTIPAALTEIQAIRIKKELNTKQLDLLAEYENYLKNLLVTKSSGEIIAA